jgi:hypothetical protein
MQKWFNFQHTSISTIFSTIYIFSANLANQESNLGHRGWNEIALYGQLPELTCLWSLLGWGKTKRWTEFVVAANTTTDDDVSNISTCGRSEAFWKWMFKTFPRRLTSRDSSHNSRVFFEVLLIKYRAYMILFSHWNAIYFNWPLNITS